MNSLCGILNRKTAVLAAGDFPAPGGLARRLLESAERVICCDSAADAYWEEFAREPDAVVGDCDSVRRAYRNLVRVAEQDTNDLTKAISYCRSRNWRDLVILGALGIVGLNAAVFADVGVAVLAILNAMRNLKS